MVMSDSDRGRVPGSSADNPGCVSHQQQRGWPRRQQAATAATAARMAAAAASGDCGNRSADNPGCGKWVDRKSG
jgi:hypothetical protein